MCFAVKFSEMDLFEDTLKSALVHISFNKSAKYRTNWFRQVKEIDCYWDEMISDIQEKELVEIFLWACRKKKLEFDPLDFKHLFCSLFIDRFPPTTKLFQVTMSRALC